MGYDNSYLDGAQHMVLGITAVVELCLLAAWIITKRIGKRAFP